jgi:hypothetical protein
MSLSGNKENIGVMSLGSKNTSEHTDWVQCTPVVPSVAAAASCKKAVWKPVDDEVLVDCLQQQQATNQTLASNQLLGLHVPWLYRTARNGVEVARRQPKGAKIILEQ